MAEEPHEKIYLSKKRIFMNNFMGGIGWAIGATIGFALLVAILGFIAGQINFIPVIGNFVAEVNTFVEENSSR